jgi:hypothetical protein
MNRTLPGDDQSGSVEGSAPESGIAKLAIDGHVAAAGA